MKIAHPRALRATALALLVGLLLAACGTSRIVPISGRKQRVSTSYNDGQMLALGSQYYTQYLSQAKISTDKAKTEMVRRVGTRLAAAVETYLAQHGYADEVPYYQWEFNLVADQQVNAFCMPGGKIVVYEGLLPVTQTEAALAVVLGHEIAHAVAKHSAEQNTKQQWQQIGMMVGQVGMQAAGVDADLANLALQGSGTVLGLTNLAYSRKHELAADHVGLDLAAMAGYDPRVAPAFWQRMAAASGGAGGSDFLSTHPSDDKRIAQLEALMPEALRYYNATTGTATSPSTSTPAAPATQPAGGVRTIDLNSLRQRSF